MSMPIADVRKEIKTLLVKGNASAIENIVLEIKNKTYHEEPILPREQPKNRSYGNKYIKRKYR